MKSSQVLFVSAQGWMQFNDGRGIASKAYPRLEAPSVVVVDFEQCQSGVLATKGKASHAAAQIEKLVRTEGQLEGPLKVFVHRQVRHVDSALSFYTAVPLDSWQTLQSWAKEQKDHCLLVPVAGLLAGAASGRYAHVLRSGLHLRAYIELGGKLHFVEASGLGESEADMQSSLRALVSQMLTSVGQDVIDGFYWSSAFSSDAASDQSLASMLVEISGKNVKLMPHESLRGEQVGRGSTALPHLISAAGLGATQSSTLSRLAWLSESYVLPLSVVVGVCALGLAGFAFLAHKQAEAQASADTAVRSEAESLRQRAVLASQVPQTDASSPAISLVKDLGHAAIYDPVRLLATLRGAAGSELRIKGLQFVKADSEHPARFRVEGVVADGRNDELSRFLSELGQEGWLFTPTNPSDGALGAFAYHLSPRVDPNH